jgi:hypothetical protein
VKINPSSCSTNVENPITRVLPNTLQYLVKNRNNFRNFKMVLLFELDTYVRVCADNVLAFFLSAYKIM